jgi:pimeloyl-ACP methyl ester carboxylesterase
VVSLDISFVLSVIDETDVLCPIHSLPGYMYSSAPPLDAEFGIEGMARVVHGLMTGLGFKEYAAQGGDLGAFISRLLACRYDECKGEFRLQSCFGGW